MTLENPEIRVIACGTDVPDARSSAGGQARLLVP
jgi:hypothetical protein